MKIGPSVLLTLTTYMTQTIHYLFKLVVMQVLIQDKLISLLVLSSTSLPDLMFYWFNLPEPKKTQNTKHTHTHQKINNNNNKSQDSEAGNTNCLFSTFLWLQKCWNIWTLKKKSWMTSSLAPQFSFFFFHLLSNHNRWYCTALRKQ